MPWVLPAALKLPELYDEFVECFSWVNVAWLPRFVRLECAMHFDHYDRLWMMTLGPLLVTVVWLVCWVVQRRRMNREPGPS